MTEHNFKAQYYELRKCAKQLIFENHALHSEIVQCKGEVGKMGEL